MLSKLALRNVKRQVGNYLIYFMTVVFTVAMLFSVSNIIFSENLMKFATSKEIRGALICVVVFICTIVAFVLSYATSFMLKLRKREFGTYLTLGMTRKNILVIFIAETTIICVGALGIGLVLGLFLYQGLTAVMMRLLEMEFSIAAYSVQGLILTVCLVLGIFLLASITSAIYLRRVSIYDLIHGDKKVEKTVKHPTTWLIVTILSLCLLIDSLIFFNRELDHVILDGASSGGIMTSVLVFAVSVILFHIGLAKSAVYLLLRQKKMCSRGTNTFVLRQLSGTLSTNSVMLGFLAFLLTFTIVGANLAFIQKATQEEQLNSTYPYDILYTHNIESDVSGPSGSEGIPVEQAERTIQNYTEIRSKYSYNVYTSGSSEFYNQTRFAGDGSDNFMKLSDFNALIQPLGFERVELQDEYLIIANLPEIESTDWSHFSYQRGGKTYSFNSLQSHYPMFNHTFFYVVIPDEAVIGMEPETSYTVYDTSDEPYDAPALKEELKYTTPLEEYDGLLSERCDYSLREYGRQQQNQTNAILVVGALFAAAIFLFLAMAILALKTLSTLSEDKQRYGILYRLGAGRQMQEQTLFRQTFSFFLLPFVAPLLTSIPIVFICQHLIDLSGLETLTHQIPVIAAATAGVLVLIYLLYYAATYLIAKKAVVHSRH